MHTAPDFWAQPPGFLADMLLPIGAAWDTAGRLRRALSRLYCPTIPVVCVGSLVVGGAGKTPVALAMTSYLAARGIEVHVVTRGYGGHLRGPVQVDPLRHDADAVGDEALLLAARAPCWVARDRAAGARAAVAVGARAFPDHYPFRAGEIERLHREAEQARARLVTTAKDIVRVPQAQRAGIEVLEVEIRWPDPAALARLIGPVVLSALGNGRGSAD